jgi:hypothetical protein
MRNERGSDRFPDHAKVENLAEKQQEERTGKTKEQRREEITKAWRDSADTRTFIKSLQDAGYIFARGDKRTYVVVDLYGEIHSLSRQLIGVKAKEVKARLADHPIENLPTAAQAQDLAREWRQALIVDNGQKKRDGQLTSQQRRDALAEAHTQRRTELETKRQQLAQRHGAERQALADMQSARNAQVARDRAARQPKGLVAFLSRVTGFDALSAFRRNWQDRQREEEYRQQSAALARKHEREMDNFQHQDHGLTSLDKRERRSLEIAIRRDGFRNIAAPPKTMTAAPERTPDDMAKIERARQLAADFRRASQPKTPTPELKPAFSEAAAPTAAPAKSAPETLSAKFKQAVENKEARQPEAESSGGKKRAEELTPEQKRALDLAEEFRRAARPHKKDLRKDRGGKDRNYRQPPPDYSFRR